MDLVLCSALGMHALPAVSRYTLGHLLSLSSFFGENTETYIVRLKTLPLEMTLAPQLKHIKVTVG